jgi:hypothetical protein
MQEDVHCNRKKDAGLEAFEHNIGQSLEDSIGDEEDGKSKVVVRRVHRDIGCQVRDLGIAYVSLEGRVSVPVSLPTYVGAV